MSVLTNKPTSTSTSKAFFAKRGEAHFFAPAISRKVGNNYNNPHKPFLQAKQFVVQADTVEVPEKNHTQRVKDITDKKDLQGLIAIQRELRKLMLVNPLSPPQDVREGLATARHWLMEQVAEIRGKSKSKKDSSVSQEDLEKQMDNECEQYLKALLEGDPQYRYEHYKADISNEVFEAVRLHTALLGKSQVGNKNAEKEARKVGRLPKDSWCGAFAHTQAELAGGFDNHWSIFMQGEGGLRSALGYGLANPWIWVFDKWMKLRDYHRERASERWYEEIKNSPPTKGIQPGDLVLIDNHFGTNPDHITTAISFDGAVLKTVGGNQGSATQNGSGVGTDKWDISKNPDPKDITAKNEQTGKDILDAKGNRTEKGSKTSRVHGIGRWSIVDYEKHIYSESKTKPANPPSANRLTELDPDI